MKVSEIENKYELDVESVTKKIVEFVGKENERWKWFIDCKGFR